MEQLDYNLLYRWFVGLSPDDLVWDPTCSRRTATGCRAARYRQVHDQAFEPIPQVKPLLSDEHFSVDGTPDRPGLTEELSAPRTQAAMIDAGANFHGQKRKTTRMRARPIDCRLYRKRPGGRPKLCYIGHARWRTGHGLAVAGMVTLATRHR